MQVVIDNILTNYEQFGEAGKPILLILPGWMRSLTEWTGIAKKLTDKYRVVILDFPGFSATLRPEKDWDTFDYANFTKAFLRKLNIQQCTLLGHSFGGRIAIILASDSTLLPLSSPRAPSVVEGRKRGSNGNLEIKKLILVDSAGYEKKSADVKIKILISKTIAKILRLLMGNKIISRLKNNYGAQDYRNAKSMRKIFIKIVNQDLSNLMPKIICPTVIVWGEKDKILPLARAKIMKRLIPNSILRIAWEAGHDPHLGKPEQFLQTLREYL